MPELPEVEVVRRGLERWVTGRAIGAVTVLHPRSVRRHVPGPEDFAGRLAGRLVTGTHRRGKYLWLTLDSGDALLAHLGMSGQLLVQPPAQAAERHLRVRLPLRAAGAKPAPAAAPAERPAAAPADAVELRFVDQRTFGHLLVDTLVPDDAGRGLPSLIRHIARDPLDPAFDDEAFAAALRRRRTGVKRALLDQSLISGVGNIYADEALWRARLHWTQPTETLDRERVAAVLAAAREVMRAALAEGGTSFDSLYVNVNGESGYFARGLRAYGRRDEPCERCGTPIRREVFMNRSSFSCPTCQPTPDGARF
ncbi:bifunctional DNA-formamidopyrimidine glycosylase/DNA-(apurinic or apyrimidinic site) lyase [Marinitenerispora sediminis]|uniref:Formamidopyrimidine-DNA glycosylase n=1 Tax=Marinitenerispora sediminis TaxID=1931232 RepID=A0A368TBB1_9ACTN|nr:bifunctional DNA-formamidopyrimidine glycosylase/DNA-(apurinic or apyrimidinic site) lyase [Marinitenerispora sediminis]RCV54047.1 bifunctional DNA-formamidopyrimidine glycosylase/DNA-(apurinic or apyrimidinic site) lyase [Marinitenerispora sediminis]RCV60803.1 bifunctional DNA-formamidopyrimidine glycosylase/DNA-(apurinic or apyrimidinic site) lyase [Marinitenerispora sediminis]RCV62433.1 bifunctional DNA-formamidopyrimidine glycosylase/DNA-(apurinic or apyrimidinic site) lyase [Mariniteneri